MKWITISTLFIVVLLVPAGRAQADVIYLDHDTASENVQNTAFGAYQELGTGFSGTLTQFELYTTDVYTPFSNYLQANLQAYTDSGYTMATGSPSVLQASYSGSGLQLGTWTGSVAMDPTLYYRLEMRQNYGFGAELYWMGTTADVYPGGSAGGPGLNGIADFSFALYGVSGGGGAGCADGSIGTCIDIVIPEDGTTIATTSFPIAVGSTGYVSASDFQTGATWLRLNYFPAAHSKEGALYGNLATVAYQRRVELPSSGAYSTTTVSDSVPPLVSGAYLMTQTISVPLAGTPAFSVFGFNIPSINTGALGFYKDLVSTSTIFAIGTTTALDRQFLTDAQQIRLTGSSINIQALGTSCDLFAATTSVPYFYSPFNWNQCMQYAFIPDDASMAQIANSAQNLVFNRWPIGYLTRISNLLSGTATTSTTTLPHLQITAPPSAHGVPFPIAANLDLNIFDNLLSSSSFLGTATSSDGKTFKDVVEPINNYVAIFCTAFAVIFIIIMH